MKPAPYETRAEIARLVMVMYGHVPDEARVARLAELAGEFTEQSPPLSEDQRTRLAILFRPSTWTGAT